MAGCRAVLVGSVSSTAAALRGFRRGGLELCAVLGQGREHAVRISDWVDLEREASAADVPFVAFDRVSDSAVQAAISEARPDWLFVIGLSQLVPADIAGAARLGAVGFHPTPLPEGRGRAPVAWTLLLEKQAAANLFCLTDEADAGDIIEQRPVEVRPDDYAADLITRTNDVLETMTAELAPSFAGGDVPRTPQDHRRATCYPRRRPEDGRILWQRPARVIHKLIRAVSHPYPGAFTLSEQGKVLIWRAEVVDSDNTAAPGTVIAVENEHPVVQTGDGALRLTDVEVGPGVDVTLWRRGALLRGW
mgnify:CR=1 FL=1